MIPKIYYHKSIIKEIDDLISRGFESYSSCEEIDKDILTTFVLAQLGDDSSSFVADDNYNQTFKDFIQYLRTPSLTNAHDLAETLRKNAVEHYSFVLSELFDERLEEARSERNYSLGYIQKRHHDNGELYWSKTA